jgi:hypothetical protein
MKRANSVKVGYAAWMVAFVELWIIVFWPSIRLWLSSR